MHFQFTGEFWVQLVVYIVSVVAFLNKLATKDEVKEKIGTVYKRLDDVKIIGESTFVRKDICCEMHRQTKEDIKRMEEDFKTFRHDTRNVQTAILCKIDELREDIVELKTMVKGKA